MILSIGNSLPKGVPCSLKACSTHSIYVGRGSRLLKGRAGVSFIEVMVAMVILSAGVVTVLRALLVSLDRTRYLRHRLYATVLLDNTIAAAQRRAVLGEEAPSFWDETALTDTGLGRVRFQPETRVGAIEGFASLRSMTVAVKWREGRRPITISRSAYIGDWLAERLDRDP